MAAVTQSTALAHWEQSMKQEVGYGSWGPGLKCWMEAPGSQNLADSYLPTGKSALAVLQGKIVSSTCGEGCVSQEEAGLKCWTEAPGSQNIVAERNVMVPAIQIKRRQQHGAAIRVLAGGQPAPTGIAHSDVCPLLEGKATLPVLQGKMVSGTCIEEFSRSKADLVQTLKQAIHEMVVPLPPASGQVPLPYRILRERSRFQGAPVLPERKRSLRPIPPSCITLVVRNVPLAYTQEELLEEWQPDGSFDYLHLPYHTSKKRPTGYAYINFTSHSALLSFQDRWHGRFLSKYYYQKPLDIVSADTQGFRANMLMLKGKVLSLEKAGFLPLVYSGTQRLDAKTVLEHLIDSHLIDTQTSA